MLGLDKVLQSKRVDGFVIRPAEDFVEKLYLAVSVDLGHQIPPLLPLAGDLIYNKVQRMDGLGDVIPGEGEGAFLNGMYPAAFSRRYFLAAPGTYKTLLAEHLEEMLLRIGNILKAAMRTLDYPLGL